MTFNHYVDEKLGFFANNIHSIQVSQISYTFLCSRTASDGKENEQKHYHQQEQHQHRQPVEWVKERKREKKIANIIKIFEKLN